MPDLGRSLLIIGAVIAAIGGAIMLFGKLPWLGRLPGDLYLKRDSFTLFFPLTTCIILSAVISLILWLLRK